MFGKSYSFESVTQMGCCGCFRLAFANPPKMLAKPKARMENHASQECLLDEELEDEDDSSQNSDGSDTGHGVNSELRSPTKCSEGILMYRTQRGLICREFPVKETHRLIRSEVLGGILFSYGCLGEKFYCSLAVCCPLNVLDCSWYLS